MSNIHGLDFLRREHTLEEDGEPKTFSTAAVRPTIERSTSWMGPDTETLRQMVADKPDLEKQFDVIHFLQAHRSSGCLAPSVIYQRTGIDLQEADESVAEMLQHNLKIRVELVPDPENPSLMIATYTYQAKYNQVRDRTTLLAQINRCKNGVPRRDLEDAYDGVEKDLDTLITAGDVLALQNTEDKTQIMFPRGEAFLVELDGIVSIPASTIAKAASKGLSSASTPVVDKTNGTSATINANEESKESPSEKEIKTDPSPTKTDGDDDDAITTEASSEKKDDDAKEETSRADTPKSSENGSPAPSSVPSSTAPNSKPKRPKVHIMETDMDPRSQIRRGEAVQIGGQWFRMSSAVKDGPLGDQPARAQAPLSVVSLQDLSKRNDQDGYIRPLSESTLPLDHRLPATALDNLQKTRLARELLIKLAHGRSSGGVASQLLGSHAHASNPVSLAASFGTASLTGNRKRPGRSNVDHQNTNGGAQSKNNHKRSQDTAAQARAAAADPFLALYTHARRHGCTKDVRAMYLATRSEIPRSDHEMKLMLVEHKLLDPGEEMRRPRLKRKSNVDNDGKPKKRRYYERKNQRMTNTHLEGTEIGAVLRRAQEKQKHGEQVGDGGM